MGSAGSKRSIEVKFIGGPYDGDVMTVDASVDPFGDEYPALPEFRRPVPPPFELLPAAQHEPSVHMDRILTYYREHRGGRWVYVLAGVDEAGLPGETDPLLEQFIAHIRKHWSTRQIATQSTAVPFENRVHYGADFEEYLRRTLMRSLHDEADKQDIMIIDVSGPNWRRQPDSALDEVYEVRAVGIPRFHKPQRRLGQSESGGEQRAS